MCKSDSVISLKCARKWKDCFCRITGRKGLGRSLPDGRRTVFINTEIGIIYSRIKTVLFVRLVKRLSSSALKSSWIHCNYLDFKLSSFSLITWLISLITWIRTHVIVAEWVSPNTILAPPPCLRPQAQGCRRAATNMYLFLDNRCCGSRAAVGSSPGPAWSIADPIGGMSPMNQPVWIWTNKHSHTRTAWCSERKHSTYTFCCDAIDAPCHQHQHHNRHSCKKNSIKWSHLK